MVDKVLGWIRQLTELGLAIIALGVVLQVIFGAAVPFLGLDIVGSVVALVKQIGSEGLVGLVAVCVLRGSFLLSLSKKKYEHEKGTLCNGVRYATDDWFWLF